MLELSQQPCNTLPGLSGSWKPQSKNPGPILTLQALPREQQCQGHSTWDDSSPLWIKSREAFKVPFLCSSIKLFRPFPFTSCNLSWVGSSEGSHLLVSEQTSLLPNGANLSKCSLFFPSTNLGSSFVSWSFSPPNCTFAFLSDPLFLFVFIFVLGLRKYYKWQPQNRLNIMISWNFLHKKLINLTF